MTVPIVTRLRAPAREISAGGRRFPVDVARHPRARRYVLRLAPDGRLRLTVPRRASIAGGLRFAARQETWILREWQRLESRAADWTIGTIVWFRGRQAPLVADAGTIGVAGGDWRVPHEPGRVRHAAQRALWSMASVELTARTRELARRHGIAIDAVRVRNQRSRWGSCSARGTIALNWRLIQMPDEVAEYVILHELAHRRQPNHSPRFWREVAALCPAWRDAERWLRRHGKELL